MERRRGEGEAGDALRSAERTARQATDRLEEMLELTRVVHRDRRRRQAEGRRVRRTSD